MTTIQKESVENKLDWLTEIPETHSKLQSISLHLLPGILTGAVVFSIRGAIQAAGYPTPMSLIVAIPLILIPVELGILYFHGMKLNGRFSLKGIVLYRDRIPTWKYVVVSPLVAFLAFAVLVLFQPWDSFFYRYGFSWIPALESGLGGGFSKSSLLITYIFAIVFGAFLGPITEELYFRGFLLPRMPGFGRWTVPVHALLFALYHTFTIWQFITRTIMMLPLIIAVRRTNVYVGMIAHVMINLFSPVLALLAILSMPS
jgi:uncharacterized protein